MSQFLAEASPLFWPLRPWLLRLPDTPDLAALQALAGLELPSLADGRPVRFVPPRADGLAYESRVWLHGEIETRPDCWHDFFNALIWFAFPHTKRALTSAHVAAMQPAGQARGGIRDALTHFDECGVLVLSSCPDLLDLLRQFDWRTLFVKRREDVKAHMRFVLFGHASYEALLAPFRGLTAKAVLYEMPAAVLAASDRDLLAAVDQRLAGDLLAGVFQRPRDFQPLPLLGIPGVLAANEDPTYYDDTWQFRPGRRAALSA